MKKKVVVTRSSTYDPLSSVNTDLAKPFRQMLFAPDEQYLLNEQLVLENPEEHYRRFVIEQAVKLFKEARQKETLEKEIKLIECQEKACALLKSLKGGDPDEQLERDAHDYDRLPPVHRRPMTLTLPNRLLYSDCKFI